MKKRFSCVLHGSFRKHFTEIKHVHGIFTAAGIDVIAPDPSEIVGVENGFSFLSSDVSRDRRVVELLFLQEIKCLGKNGFSYFVNPNGYVGLSASYELGIVSALNIHTFFLEKLSADHPAYLHKNSVLRPEDLVKFIAKNDHLPSPVSIIGEEVLLDTWQRTFKR